MLYSINYEDLAGRVNPLVLAKYVLDSGWNEIPVKKESIRIFQKRVEGRLFQITVPMELEFSDYKARMFDNVNEISQAEKRPLNRTLLYLLNPGSDILRVRIKNDSVKDGNILIDDAVNLYDNTKKLLLSTAQDVLNPTTYHQGRPDTHATNFVSGCRFGQTEIGSYIVSVICPFTELQNNGEYEQLSFLSDDETAKDSITRKVTRRIIDNINIIKNGISRGTLDTNDSGHVISANFYDALAGMGIASENTAVEFNVDWSPILKEQTFTTEPVSIDYHYYDEIRRISDRIKKSEPETRSVIGRVTELKSVQDVDQRKSGTIKIVYLDEDGKKQNSSVTVSKEIYDKAIDAHKNGLYVKVALIPAKGTSKLNCSNFEVMN